MIKIKTFVYILIIALAVYLGYFLKQQGTGYVLFSYQDLSIETTLLVFSAIQVTLFVILYFTLRFIFNLIRVPQFIKRRYDSFQEKKSSNALIQGLSEITEGHFKKAEHILVKQAGNNNTAVLNYLLAARAAQLQHADERRDNHLKKAHEINPEADIAISLTQAELQLARNQNELALATLNHLHQSFPKHEYVMRLMSRAYLQLEDWTHLCPLLSDIRHNKYMPEEDLQQVEYQAYNGYLKYAGKIQDQSLLKSVWEGAPKHLKKNDALVRMYILQLIHNHLLIEAEQLIREQLNKKWNDELIYLYASFIGEDPETHPHNDDYYNKVLKDIEIWLKQYPHHAGLLLAAGKVCVRLKLWGKARGYFEASLGIKPIAETYQQMALLLEQLEETEEAQKYYRMGLNFSISNNLS